eukprot:5574372-Karenia_brevis.AAC.1
MDTDRWTRKILEWAPSLTSRGNNSRCQGRPRHRWSDDVMRFCQTQGHNSTDVLQMVALHKDYWEKWESEFADEYWRRNSEP